MNCGKCGGKGYIGAYKHISNGVCFQCNGSGTTTGSNGKKQFSLWGGSDEENVKYIFSFHTLEEAIEIARQEEYPYSEVTIPTKKCNEIKEVWNSNEAKPDYRKARGILAGLDDEPAEVSIRRLRDNSGD